MVTTFGKRSWIITLNPAQEQAVRDAIRDGQLTSVDEFIDRARPSRTVFERLRRGWLWPWVGKPLKNVLPERFEIVLNRIPDHFKIDPGRIDA